jgi:VIT1/CCC1 family predicted Fe2+/Mn2+ transporter
MVFWIIPLAAVAAGALFVIPAIVSVTPIIIEGIKYAIIGVVAAAGGYVVGYVLERI